jgi:hypothetical protein
VSDIVKLQQVSDYYSQQYHYLRYPAKVGGRAGHFAVWSRDVERPNPEHVTWSPEIVAIVAESYRTPEWHAERAEQAARPSLAPGDIVRLGGVVIEVPKRAAEYVSGVPCKEVDA